MPTKLEEGYKPIALNQPRSSDEITELDDLSENGTPCNIGVKNNNAFIIWTYMSTALNVFLALSLIFLASKVQNLSSPLPPWPDDVYSPARHVVQYEKVIFNDGFNSNDSMFIGPPTDESDEAWENLWEPPLFAEITAPQARRLPNKTIPIPNTSHHLVGLDVFHQLHCLNTLRKRLRPERYDANEKSKTKDVATGMKHWDHCVESLRQSLICSADLSAVSWHWTEEEGWRTGTNEHICRKWNKVMQWSEDHKRVHNNDGSLVVDGKYL